MPDIPIPRTREEITPEWMTAVLASGGYLDGGRVERVSVEDIGVGRGYVGQTLRVTLTFSGPAGRAPASVVAKLPTFVELTSDDQALVDLLYSTEIQWYRDLSADAPVRVPISYWGAMEPDAGRYCLLLEDLSDLDTSDQLTACTPEQAELAVINLAKLHARWWGSERLSQLDWLPTSEFQGGLAQSLYSLGWGRFGETLGAALPREFEAIGDRIGPSLPRLFEMGSDSATTLVHGDYRIENFLFGEPGSADELVILDWQLVGAGSGLRDLGYFLSQNLTPEARREDEERLLRLYQDTLTAHGVRGYDFDRCRDDYRLGLLIAMFIPVNGVRTIADLRESGGGDLDGEERAAFEQAMESGTALVRVMAERTIAAILDNRAAELLDR